MKQEKAWIKKGKELLDDSLNPIPQELNELDWKEALSPSNSKLTKHLSAFANMPGGGFLVFGVEDGTGVLKGVSTRQSVTITEKLGSLGRDTLSPVIKIDHSVESYNNVPILFIYIAKVWSNQSISLTAQLRTPTFVVVALHEKHLDKR